MLTYSFSSLFATVTNCCIYKDIKFTRLLISTNLVLHTTPNLLPTRRCRTISNEKPNNEAEELSENDLKISNVKTYLHIAVMHKMLSKDLKILSRVVQTISVLSKSGFIHRIVPKTRTFWGLRPCLIAIYRVHQCLRYNMDFVSENGETIALLLLKKNFPTAFFGRDLTFLY